MKTVKKILIGFVILLVVLVAAAAILPIVFKDDIKAAIDKQLAKSINADMVFDVNNFSLTVFRNFPNITAEIKELGVFNRAPFEGEHLFVVDRLDIEINLADVLFGDQLRLKGITLVGPQINVKVLPDGRANYDIAIPSTDTTQASEPSKFSFGIDHWEVIKGELTYDDQSIPYYLSMKGLNHTGSGDFTQDIFDLKTHTVVDSVSTAMGKMQFLANKRAEVDAVISISEEYTKYTFKENKALINDFALSFDGWFKMNPADYGMDVTFSSPANSFKSLLSLIPGLYTQNFQNIQTAGDLTFSGFVKGNYSEKQMPAFQVNLAVNNAMFKYPDLPTAVKNIQVDLLIDNKDGIIDNTLVNLKKMHLDFGNNPVDARLIVENLKNYKLDGNVRARLNLAELSTMFPMQGTTLKGLLSADVTAKGVYDATTKTIPASGTVNLKDFGYTTAGMPPLTLQEASASFDPKAIELSKLNGTIGRSDFMVNGKVENYIGYAFQKATLKGNVTFRSTLLDLNEFMTDTPTQTAKDTTSFGVIPVPQNVDFVLHSSVNTVKMMDYTMTNAMGDIIVRDGIANLNGLRFGMLGGNFSVSGTYNTKDLQHPKYDLGLKIEKVSIQQAASSFSMIKTYAPIAGLVNGDFSTDFKLNGELTQQMMPNLATVNGAGLIKIAQAALTKSSFVSQLTSLTSLNNTNGVSLKDVLMSASIDNGRFSVKPFDIKIGDYAATVSGSTGLDMSLDYSLKMMVPAGQLGSQVQGFLNQYTGSTKPTDKIPVTIAVGGTAKSPKTTLVATEQKQQVQDAAKTVVTQKSQEATQKLLEGAKPEDVLKGLTNPTAPKQDTTKKDTTKANPANQLMQLKDLLKKKKKN